MAYIADVNDDAMRNTLRAARQAAGLTLDALQARAHVNRNVISGIENGRKTPTIRTLARIIEAIPGPAADSTLTLAAFFTAIERDDKKLGRPAPRAEAVVESSPTLEGSLDARDALFAAAAESVATALQPTVLDLQASINRLAGVADGIARFAVALSVASPAERRATTRVVRSAVHRAPGRHRGANRRRRKG